MKRRSLILGIAAVATAVLGGAAWKKWQGLLGPSLAEELAAAKREGVPIDASDLTALPVPEAENAAPFYLAAAAHAKSAIGGTRWTTKFSEAALHEGETVADLSEGRRRQLTALITPLEPGFAMLRKASRFPHLSLHRQYHQNDGFEDSGDYWNLTRALLARAELHAARGDRNQAFNDIETAARVNGLFADLMSPGEAFVRWRLEESILATMRRVAALEPENEWLPERIRTVVAALGPPPDPRRNYKSAPLADRQMVAFFAAGGDECMPGEPILRLRSVRDANDARVVAYWRTLYAQLPKDPLDFDGIRRSLEIADEQRKKETSFRNLTPHFYFLEGADAFARTEAHRRVARGAADVLESWAKGKGLPKPLADPFGAHLRYRVKGNECTVYSVDVDRKDDGGIIRDRNHRTGDIAWRFPLPGRGAATIRVAKR